MQVNLKQRHKITEEEIQRFETARKDFAKAMKEIEPFIKKTEKKPVSTSGEWVTSEIEQQ